MKIMEIGKFELGQEVKVLFQSGNAIEGKVVDFTESQKLIWIENSEDVFQVNMYHASVFMNEQEAEVVYTSDAHKQLAEDLFGGLLRTVNGNRNQEIEDRFNAPDQVEKVVQTEKAPNSIRTLKELKEVIADELKGQWYEEIESVKVAVYNAEEDGEECWDCEVQIALDNGDSIYPTFGTFFNEKDALKHARDMRTKLKRTYEIVEKVWVYSC